MNISSQYLWHQVLERLQIRLTKPAFETWIKSAIVQEWKDNCLIIQVANPFVLNHLQKTYQTIITQEVAHVVGYPVDIQLTTSQTEEMPLVSKGEISQLSSINQIKPESPKLSKLNPRYTFSRFVVGPTNRMAHAASLAVAESPGREFNPLFLCGGVGLGKTHLMQAIAHYR
ncbi:MAG TPA: chromosomal replication initiator protein DnaA, partial [Cyanothece sp. UBA12306]|nr:chromosomal replication initiator protein DnaA [Cyanothece sp. UBA12306]